jgi:hypothetical protein
VLYWKFDYPNGIIVPICGIGALKVPFPYVYTEETVEASSTSKTLPNFLPANEA